MFISGNTFPISGNGNSILGFVRPHPLSISTSCQPFPSDVPRDDAFPTSRQRGSSDMFHQIVSLSCFPFHTAGEPRCTVWTPGRITILCSLPDPSPFILPGTHSLASHTNPGLLLTRTNHARSTGLGNFLSPLSRLLFPQISPCLPPSVTSLFQSHLIIRPSSTFLTPDAPY